MKNTRKHPFAVGDDVLVEWGTPDGPDPGIVEDANDDHVYVRFRGEPAAREFRANPEAPFFRHTGGARSCVVIERPA